MDLNMEAKASEGQVMGLVSRLDRDGHHLTPSALAKMHQILSDCVPDNRTEGSQRELGQYIKERCERDDK